MRSWYAIHGGYWEAHEARELPGQRSWAWWSFVADEAMPESADELQRLLELDALTEPETMAILKAGDEAVADRDAGRAWRTVPAANTVRRHMGLPELPTHLVHNTKEATHGQ
jgi:hypothetical protein